MTKKELIRRLLPVVAHTANWERLEDYINSEVDDLVEKLITCTDVKLINRYQGEILRLRLILDIPEQLKKIV